jgi:hypothetical protein
MGDMNMTTGAMTTSAVIPASGRPSPKLEVFAAIDQLLRDRAALLERIEAGVELSSLARTMLLTILASAAVFGASLGVLRGGEQILFAAIKLPLVVLLTAAVATPTLCALRFVMLGRTDMQRDIAIVLSSLALGSLVLAALAPIILLAVSWGAVYHELILIVVGCCLVGGAVGLSLFVRGTAGVAPGSRALILGIVLVVMALVGSQMAWTFRPYVVRPRTEDVPMIRALEGSFIDSVTISTSSALGIYSRERAPLPGERR